MNYYAGIDVSLKESSVCVVDAAGKVAREVKVSSEPECLVGYFDQLELPVVRIGLEAGPLSQWLWVEGRRSQPGAFRGAHPRIDRWACDIVDGG